MKFRRLDLQAKIVLILFGVIPSTFAIVTLAQNKLTQPLLEEEFRQVGVTTAKTLAAEILSSRWLQLDRPTPVIENYIQSFLYAQPNIIRIDVIAKDPLTGVSKQVATNIEDDPAMPLEMPPLVDQVVTEKKVDESGTRFWEISAPIEQKTRDSRSSTKKILGNVHLMISLKSVDRISSTLWKITVNGALFTTVILLLVLSYLLRKMILNDRLLKLAESENHQLNERLHEAQHQLMNTEKLAILGQLTASVAHEIGSPLHAIGGHLHLLKEEISHVSPVPEGLMRRLEVINSQVGKIEEIVRSFLHSTTKPASQRQLVDVNQLVEKTLEIVRPRTNSGGVSVECQLDRRMGPLRIVPLEFEQILLNLLNNSLDSVDSKKENKKKQLIEFWPEIRVSTQRIKHSGKEWAEISVYDTGEGIPKMDLNQVIKPFFTTKRRGHGTGLGLPICRELVDHYGGKLEIASKEGAWTEVIFRLPYSECQ